MKKSTKPTEHVLIKAYTKSDWAGVEFAIIQVTASWKALIKSRLKAISQFKADRDFNCHSFWDASISYYNSTDKGALVKAILSPDEDWAYVTSFHSEDRTFKDPINRLEAKQLLITKDGIARYKAYCKYTGIEIWTEEFDLNKLFIQ
ncbi:hypothetical protein FBD94_16800 [Pedobacter hiemivivus]|uniref:Uncharacterized protein n=1 Tax=Pedobacter hiemivivus TaxID=2530454 RepID=A0A4U1G8V2_9SPHI|nr:hypothetical protein [Pedobacter hiemivivus]TKC59190.1 hypothetical protein FBD94_16800 [Pedobacter hiemivivus]